MLNEQNFRAFKLWISSPSLSAIGYYVLLREYAAKMKGKSLSYEKAEEMEQKSIRDSRRIGAYPDHYFVA